MNNKETKGLGGWLILVGIGVVLSPIRLLMTHVPIYKPIFEDGTWEALTTAGSQAYHPAWGPLLIGEIAFNLLMLVASLYLIYLFFSKHYLFPKVFITVVVVSLFFIPLDALLVSRMFPNEPMFDPETAKEFIRTLIAGAIWVPYMLVSKRVKATFIEKRPNETPNDNSNVSLPPQRTASSISKPLILSVMLAAGGVAAIATMIGNETGAEKSSPTSSTATDGDIGLIKGFQHAAEQLNQGTPKMIDEETRMDNVSVGPGAVLTYHYTFPNYASDEVDAEWVSSELRQSVEQSVCNSLEMKPALQYGGMFKYSYSGSDQKLVGSFMIGRRDCGYPARSPNSLSRK